MKETKILAAVITTLLTGERLSELIANNWMVYIGLILIVVGLWVWFFRKPPAAGTTQS